MEEIKQCYKNDAKDIVDNLFDIGVFNEKMTRDDMKALEELIAYYFNSNARSVERGLEFSEMIKHVKPPL